MTEPTPGPWLRDGTTVYALNNIGVNRFDATVQPGWRDTDEGVRTPKQELEANAMLMHAAPDLLDATKQALGILLERIPGSLPGAEQAVEALRTAIEKARGQS
jgi:hypothetical protein